MGITLGIGVMCEKIECGLQLYDMYTKDGDELYETLCNIGNIEVKYSDDQLKMANEVIRKMKSELDYVNIKFWNMIHPNDITDNSSGLE